MESTLSRSLPIDERLQRAHLLLERRGAVPAELLRPEIAASWQRCLAAGLDPERPPPLKAADGDRLEAARGENDLLRRLALAEIGNLYRQIAGSNFMIAFAAPDGMLLDTVSDDSFRATARTSRIRPGVLWAEASCGTNALGTVASLGRRLTVHGGEHFFRPYWALTCTAVPIIGPDGRVLGILDASSDCRSRQEHTQALVGMAATHIENGLFRECHRRNILIAFHSRGEYLRTLSAGLLAVENDGTILAANAQARFLLRGLPALPGRAFADVFRSPFGSLIDQAWHYEHLPLVDRVGSEFVAAVENLPRSFVPVTAAAGQPERQPDSGEARPVAPGASLRDEVREKILAAHRELGGNVSKVARRLGISRNTVYRALGK